MSGAALPAAPPLMAVTRVERVHQRLAPQVTAPILNKGSASCRHHI
jgi:hypothetical protein